MASKRPKKTKVDFSAEAILLEIQQEKEILNQINEFKSKINIKKVSEALRGMDKHVVLDFDVVGLLALIFGFDAIMWIMFSMRHVPRVFARYKNNRSIIIFGIIDYLRPERFTVELVEEIVCFLEEFA